MWETIVICTILIVVVIFLLRLFNKIDWESNRQGELYEFSSDLRFDPFPTQIDVSNPYECSGTDLRLCKMDDQTSCIGCQSMISRCTHFSVDTTYFDDDGNQSTIPANSDPNTGYCMTITNDDLNVDCNVYHGDLALIKVEPDSNTSMFFCNCKNPGFIGNTSLLGACDTAFICNGEVDNIDQPIENIKCKCPKTQYSIRNTANIPMCVDMTIEEGNRNGILNDVINEVDDQYLAPIEIFNRGIRDNLNRVDKLLHPCKFCPITKERISNGILGTIDDSKFCSIHYDNVSTRNSFFGIPYRRSPNERLLTGNEGPDAVLGVYWHEIMIYEDLGPNERQTLLFKIESNLNGEFYRSLGLDPTKEYWIKTTGLYFGLHIPSPPHINFNGIPGTTCWERWPNYDCTFGVDMMNVNDLPTLELHNAVLDYITPGSNDLRTAREIYRPSGPFLFDLEAWRGMQQLNSFLQQFSVRFSDDGGVYRYFTVRLMTRASGDESRFAGSAQLIAWGFRRISTNKGSQWEYTMYTNQVLSDWLFIQERLIPRF